MSEKEVLRILEKTASRFHDKFLDLANTLVTDNGTRVKFSLMLSRVESNRFLLKESVYVFSKELGITESSLFDLISKSRYNTKNSIYIEKLIKASYSNVDDEGSTSTKTKNIVVNLLSVFPDIKELLS